MFSTADLIEEFLETKRAEGSSAATVRWYRFQLERFANWLNGRKASLKLSRSYLAGLADAGLSHSMQRGAAIAIKSFSKWASEESSVPDFAADLRLPKKGKHLPREASLSDVAAAFTVASPRDRALVMFLIDTGARRAEVAALRWVDVDLEGERVTLTGKGDKQRRVAITDRTADLLRAIRPERVDADTRVFIGERGPLTPNGVSMVLRRLKHRAGVVGPLNPHAFRHAFGSNFVRNGGDLESLRRILGHEDIATTRTYLCLAQREVEEIQRKFSPANALEIPSLE